MDNLKAKDRILIIDDNSDILESLSRILMFEGYAVETAKSGQEALKKSREKIFSIALIDIKLPDFEGTRLLSRMEKTDPKMRKIIITGYQTLENTRESLRLGADDYLVKPIKTEELLETVRKQIEKRHKEYEDRYVLLEDSKD